MTNKKKVVEKKVKKEEIVAPPPGAGFGEIERPKKNTASMESKSDKLDKSSNVNPEIIEAPSIDEGFDQNDVLNVDPVKAQKTLRRQFLATFILGSLVIAFDLSGMVGLEPEYNIGFTLLLMGLFWLAGNKYLRNPLVRSVFADSMYYLGFLFTFVALAVSLMGLDTLIDPDVKESRDNFKLIVAQMGPALTTTVAGMAFRIYFTQFDEYDFAPVTALWLVAILFMDAIRVLSSRIFSGSKSSGILKARRDHIYHKLIDRGFSYEVVYSGLILSGGLLAAIGIFLNKVFLDSPYYSFYAFVILWISFHTIVNKIPKNV